MMRNLLSSRKIGIFLIVLMGLVLVAGMVNGATITSAGNGNWNSTTPNAPWPNGIVPTAGDDVIINTSNTVTVTVNANARSIIIKGTLNFDRGISLIVEGDITVNSGGTIVCSSGGTAQTIIVKGNFTNYGTTNFNQANVIVVGNFISPATSNLQNQGNLIIGGNASGRVNENGGSQVYIINPNSTNTLTSGGYPVPTNTTPTLTTNLNGLITTYIYVSSCGFTINGPSNTTSCSGSNVTFSIISTTATSPTYLWEENQGIGWSSLSNGGVYSGVGTKDLTISSASGMNGYIYRCKITENPGSCSKYSYAATLTLSSSPAPTAVSGTAVSTCSNSGEVNITAGSSAPNASSINWTSSGSGTWTNETSLTQASYTPSNADISAGSVTLTLTAFGNSSCGNAVSTKTLTVNPNLPASVSIGATATTICAGTSVTFTATPTNGGSAPTYQWKLNGSNVGTGGTTYTTSTLANNDLVTCVLTSNASPCLTGSPATSNTVTMTVNPSPAITSMSTTTCSEDGFTVMPVNGENGTVPLGTTYSWSAPSGSGFTGGDGSSGSPSSITGTLINPTSSAVTATYNVTPTSGVCSGSLFTVTVTVDPIPEIGSFN